MGGSSNGTRGSFSKKCVFSKAAEEQVEIATAVFSLYQAYIYAKDTGRDRWDFAVEISQLVSSGLNASHFRWLVCKGFVEHAEEIISVGQVNRRFQPTGELSFTDTTCFVLTGAGVEFAVKLLRREKSMPVEPPAAANGVSEMPRPHWDVERHELKLDDNLIKRFKHRSTNQEMILAAFQEEGWPATISDPLPPSGDTDPKRRLNDTIKGLNHHQEKQLIRFRGDGTGEGVIWEFAFDVESA